jgi:hypothetical protein
MTGAIVEEDAAGINFYQVPRSTGPVAALLLGCRRGTWNPANIGRVGSKARNPLLARNLREFPVAPNIDAGAGTPASAAVVVFQHGQRTRAIPKRLFQPQILGRERLSAALPARSPWAPRKAGQKLEYGPVKGSR